MSRLSALVSVVLCVWLSLGCNTLPHQTSTSASAGFDGVSPSNMEQSRARIHTELGAGYFARGQHGVALESLSRALAMDAAYAPAYNILALVRAELREDKLAEEAFKRALALSPNYSEARNNYGLYLCQRGKHGEGLSNFETALQNPLYATPEVALVNAGACSLAKGEVGAAEAFFIRAYKRAPGYPGAILGAAEMDYRAGRFLAARNKLKLLSEREGDWPAQALWLGVRVERVLGDRDAEASYGAQLRRRFPDAMQTQWLYLGQYDQGGGLL